MHFHQRKHPLLNRHLFNDLLERAQKSILSVSLDMAQKELIKKSNKYLKEFNNLYLRTIEYAGYTRTGICDFPALNKLNIDADEVMTYFKKFLKELRMVFFI